MINEVKLNDKSLVISHNDLNKISFPGFTQKELDFLYGTISALYNKGNEKVSISFDRMLEAVGLDYRNKSELELGPWVDGFTTKASQVICPMYMVDKVHGEMFSKVPFFGAISFSFESEVIEFSINPTFQYMIEKQKSQYTAFTLGEFKSVKKKYSKLLFRLLSQWNTYGEATYSLDELKRLLDIPDSYARISKIRSAVLIPSVKELSSRFPNLSFESIKAKNKVVGYKFTWDAEYFKDKKAKEIANKQGNKTKRKDVTPENKSVDELQDELQRMWEEKGLER